MTTARLTAATPNRRQPAGNSTAFCSSRCSPRRHAHRRNPGVRGLGEPADRRYRRGRIYGNALRDGMPASWAAGVNFSRALLRVVGSCPASEPSGDRPCRFAGPRRIGTDCREHAADRHTGRHDHHEACPRYRAAHGCGQRDLAARRPCSLGVHAAVQAAQERDGSRQRGSVRHALHVPLPGSVQAAGCISTRRARGFLAARFMRSRRWSAASNVSPKPRISPPSSR